MRTEVELTLSCKGGISAQQRAPDDAAHFNTYRMVLHGLKIESDNLNMLPRDTDYLRTFLR